jgi:hypothetical protein
MHGVVAGIQVEDDLSRCRPTGTDEEIDQVLVEDLDAADLGGADFQQDGTLRAGQLGLAAGVGVLEARQGRAAGQGVRQVRSDVAEDLEQRVGAELLGIVAVRVAGQALVDGLRKQRLGGMRDELGGARVWQTLGQVSDDAQGLLQGADGEEAGIADDAAAVGSYAQPSRADVPQGEVQISFAYHDREPPQDAKLLGKHSLARARGSPFNNSVRDPG